MNYLKHYCKLIRKAENRGWKKHKVDFYVERHHTFPKSIFGDNNRIVVLTAKEHYIAHALLEKIYIKRYGIEHRYTKKMINAHFSMSMNGYTNSILYECAKIRMSKIVSERMTGNTSSIGRKHTPESIQKMKDNHPRSWIGRTHTEETRDKLRKINLGNTNFKGKKHTEESKRKMSEAHTGKFVSEETKRRLSESHIGKMFGKDHPSTFPFKIYFVDGKTIEWFNGISAFCRENPQYTSSGIGLILNNKTKKYKDIIAVEKIYE